jgi:hypothetical protein
MGGGTVIFDDETIPGAIYKEANIFPLGVVLDRVLRHQVHTLPVRRDSPERVASVVPNNVVASGIYRDG